MPEPLEVSDTERSDSSLRRDFFNQARRRAAAAGRSIVNRFGPGRRGRTG